MKVRWPRRLCREKGVMWKTDPGKTLSALKIVRLGRGSQTDKGQERCGLQEMERWQEIQSADLSIRITSEMMY